MNKNLSFTESALNRIQFLVSASIEKTPMLRIYIEGGGCSGFTYGFKLDENYNEDEDILIEHEEIDKILKIVVDSLSFQYIKGSTINYIENFQGARFVVENPQAESTCGCGSSFSLKEIN
jgi:iron-sulfur cluster insertion protein